MPYYKQLFSEMNFQEQIAYLDVIQKGIEYAENFNLTKENKYVIDKNIADTNAKIDSAIKPMEIVIGENDPLSFSLNSSKISDNFSTIEETDGVCNDKNYNWDFINNDKNISDGISNININFDENKKSGMPTVEQLMKERDNLKL
jgi:hypothetical protein